MKPARSGAAVSPLCLIRTGLGIGITGFAILLMATPSSFALTAGKAWTPAYPISVTGFDYLSAPRLEVDTTGVPYLITSARRLQPRAGDAFVFGWRDTAWVQRWRAGQITMAPWPVQSPPGTTYLTWCGGPINVYNLMMWARVLGDSLSPIDTVTTVMDVRTEYSGAVSGDRRWLAVSDDQGHSELRVLYSDAKGPWRQAPVVGLGENGVAAGALDDTTALVAWAGYYEGIKWGELRGDDWVRTGQLVPAYQYFTNAPRLRRRPSGGQWLAWGTWDPHILLTSYRDGVWSDPESLTCAYTDGTAQHLSDSPDLSRDDDRHEYPVAVWGAQDGRGHFNICVCAPSDSGYGVGEEITQALDGGLPTVVRDRADDVWVAWMMSNYVGGVRWLHSYTTATTDTPQVAAAGRLREVRWALSTPAPRSWWAVERADGDGEFVQVARVRAGPDSLMAWTDTTAPAGMVRYRVRRESVDRRYEWLSPATRWPAQGLGPWVLRVSANPASTQVAFEVMDAIAGALEVKLYDLQGRVVWRERRMSAGSGRDAFTIALPPAGGRIRAGIYFLRARDASGRESATAKVAVVR